MAVLLDEISNVNGESAEKRETGRVEAFSDGVFAIAITLLILDVKVPSHETLGDKSLLIALLEQWPSYLAYVLSFAIIGIMWINHHRLFNHIIRIDHSLLVFNSLLLLSITFLPFPTSLLAEYIGEPGEHTAALVYSGSSIAIALFFNVLWRYASYHNRLISRRSSTKAVQAISRQYAYGPLLYSITFVLAFFSVGASMAASIALALFFALPPRSPDT